jgi:hypothetical protein
MSTGEPLDPRTDALVRALEAAAILGPPLVAAVARTVRTEWPELIEVLERALQGELPAVASTPPSAEDARAMLRARRVERRRVRFGK